MSFAPADHRGWWLAVAAHLWQAGIVIVALWGLDRLLLRSAPARYRSRVWSLALTALCVPAAVAAGWLDRLLSPWMRGVVGTGGEVTVSGLRAIFRPDLLATSPGATPSLLWALPSALWIAGVALLTVRLLRARREAAGAGSSIEPVRGERLAAAARRAGADPDRVVVSGAACMPHTRGLLRPRIVVPAELARHLDGEELAAVLAHEDAHVRRRDGIRRLVAVPVFLVFWFFPLTWLVLRRLHTAAEMACDEAVLERGFEHRVYARALARTLQLGLTWPASAPALARAGGADIRTRLGNLRRAGKETAMKRNVLTLCLAVLVLVTSVAAAAPERPSQRQRERRDAVLERFPELRRLRAGDEVVDLEIRGPLAQVLRQVAEIGGFELVLQEIPADAPVALTARNSTVVEVLGTLAEAQAIAYEVPGPRRLVVRPFRGPTGVVTRRPDPAEGPPYRIGGDIEAPEKIHHVAPEYPRAARDAGLEGVVILEARLDRDGKVDDVVVLRGLGQDLDEAAVKAVRQWRYSPTRHDGRPVEVLLTVTVQFRLERDGA